MSSGDLVDARVETTGGIEEDPRTVRARARIGHWVNGKWKLAELLGIGGTAAVYAATHRNGARVAIKIMHAEFTSDSERCARFQREGYAANLVEHPGVVSIHDDGVDDEHGQPFLVMEFLRGASLQALLGGAPGGLPVERALEWAVTLLEILERAHAKNVLHRDIKPSNLFLDDSGRLRVLDFGLAGGVAFESSTTTVSGSILGTPAFMPPEQARGDWDSVDARSDLWATGATLFTLLTGQHVHLARTAQEQLGMAMMVSPRSVRRANQALPDAVAELVDRALEFEQARRWPSATDMLEACRALVPGSIAERRSPAVRGGATAVPLRDPRIDTQKTATLSLDEGAGARSPRPRSLAGLLVAVAVVAAVIGLALFGSATKPEQRAGRASSAAASKPSAPLVASAAVGSRVVPGASGETARTEERDHSTDVAPRPAKTSLRPSRTAPAPALAPKKAEAANEPPVGSPPSRIAPRVSSVVGAELAVPSPSLADRPELEARE